MSAAEISLDQLISRAADLAAERAVKAAERRFSELAESLVGGAELVDIEEAARLLSTSREALYKRVDRGTIECVRKGGRIKFRRADLLRGDR